ncbi:3-oxoacyl-[acyl-carrier-protein] synthase III C-terminal domain-containing protein [Saccharospirillum impatiens]|uniref:3-oxoacyl-[acyl-carrier-protein] synthase III C-terminal domain-containing protein n=1 Tax=Saccharospirillum impatiens TaxID=169438 RepID=UPI0003F50E2C|nr:3-oxoacyl-[acyl-carrier-protein] synthase III C-terminal domain-containing protein [Saccharospirillum impatiens]
MRTAYITGAGSCLPGPAISNDAMEAYIGTLSPVHSRLGRATLRHNGIQQRHYARTPEGQTTHSNAQLATEAIRAALLSARCRDSRLDLLCTGTTQGDLLVPGFASAVQAELGIASLEVASFQSVCASSLMALKHAMMAVQTGQSEAAAVSGSEYSSRWFQPAFYADSYRDNPDPGIEFLRYTLSDGGAAVIVEPEPVPGRRNLRIDWIEQRSFADRFPNCMYAGTATNQADALPWSVHASPSAAHQAGAIALKQDFKLLYELFPVWIGYYLELLDARGLHPADIDVFLPHYSAESLGQEMKRLLQATGAMIPGQRWFNTLSERGNTGSASLFVMLTDWLNRADPKPGQRLLCFVPESGRALAAFMHLTVV